MLKTNSTIKASWMEQRAINKLLNQNKNNHSESKAFI